jgi:hypothetical protein
VLTLPPHLSQVRLPDTLLLPRIAASLFIECIQSYFGSHNRHSLLAFISGFDLVTLLNIPVSDTILTVSSFCRLFLFTYLRKLEDLFFSGVPRGDAQDARASPHPPPPVHPPPPAMCIPPPSPA